MIRIGQREEAISMSQFRSLERFRDDYYKGTPLESGGTSIKGKGAAPGVRDLYSSGAFHERDIILDYGAGKYARNADFLRDLGFTVYAYDPFNGLSGSDGYEYGVVSRNLPRETFDVVFTSFVLNVVPFYIEKDIVKETENLSKGNVYHITRNKDIFDTVDNALSRKDRIVTNFFWNVYQYPGDIITPEVVYDFCCYGVQTSRGFQRIPTTEVLGYENTKVSTGYKIYKK